MRYVLSCVTIGTTFFGTICDVRDQTNFLILWFKCNLDVMVSYRLERGDAMDIPHRPAVTTNYPWSMQCKKLDPKKLLVLDDRCVGHVQSMRNKEV